MPNIKAKPGYFWCTKFNHRLHSNLCHRYLFDKCLHTPCPTRKRATRKKLKKYLDELKIKYTGKTKPIEMLKLFLDKIRSRKSVGNLSADLRAVLIEEYYFEFFNEDGEQVDKHLNLIIKKKYRGR